MPAGNVKPAQLTAAAPSEATPLVSRGGYLCIHSRPAAVNLTLVLIFITVAIKEGANITLAASLAELRALGDANVVRYLPGVGTAFYCIGKASSIVAVYYCGGRVIYCSVCLLSGLGLLIITIGSPGLLFAGWVISQYCNAFVWATSTRLLADWVDGPLLGRAVGIFSVGNDVGAALFAFIFALIQAAHKDNVYLEAFTPFFLMGTLMVSNGILQFFCVRSSAADANFDPPSQAPQTFGLAVTAATDSSTKRNVLLETGQSTGGSSSESHPLDDLQLSSALWTFACHGRVWFVYFICILFTFLGANALYLPTFAIEVLQFSAGAGTAVGAAAAAGPLLGDIVAGLALDCLTVTQVRTLGVFLIVVGTVCWATIVGLLASDALDTLAVAMPVLLPLGSIGIGFYYNVVLNVWTIRFGGPVHAGTLAAMLDFGSYLLLIPYQFIIAPIAVPGQFITLWSISLGLFVVGIIGGEALTRIEERLGLSTHPLAYALWCS